MPAGRKPKYNAKLVDKICQLIEADSYTVKEICRMVKIHPATYYEWINEKPEFADIIKKAEAARTEVLAKEAEKSLMKLVKGYTETEHQVTTVGSGKFDVNGKEIPKIKEQKTVEKHFQPNTAAVIFTLTNTMPEKYKNTQSTELTGKNGKDLFAQLTDEELDARIKELERKAKL